MRHRPALCALQAAPHSAEVETLHDSGPPRPTAAETARTVLDIVAHGTLATLDADGKPLGTYASYVLDSKASSSLGSGCVARLCRRGCEAQLGDGCLRLNGAALSQ